MERVPATRIDELRPLRIGTERKKEVWSVAASESRVPSVRKESLGTCYLLRPSGVPAHCILPHGRKFVCLVF